MTTNTPNDDDGRLDATPPPADELDRLLARWHDVNAEAARAGRNRLMQSIARQRADALVEQRVEAPAAAGGNGTFVTRSAPTSLSGGGAGEGYRTPGDSRRAHPAQTLRDLFLSPYTRAAASLLLLVTAAALLLPLPASSALAAEIMVPDGGRLEARDEKGQVIGPCALEHTDVAVDVSGRFSRVTVRQRFANPYEHKIEAVYTFPLSHRGAVDRMTMTVGDRVVIGEVKEREEARRTYEAARRSGYVASLLEQQRPNIFTQSIANIEPGAEIVVEISYVELVQIADGVHRFDFPMVVSPRYIPGRSTASRALVPAELTIRNGIILRGPAALSVGQGERGEDGVKLGPLHAGALQTLLTAARPIEYPGTIWWGEGADARLPSVWHAFQAQYADGAKEIGWLYTDGTGQINGRWFYTDPAFIAETGTGFAADTDQVPDASLITPMPVSPDRRAGHDIDVTVTIDTGGPAITDFSSELHRIEEVRDAGAARRPDRVTLRLENRREIPNRDFRLEWRVADDAIEESHFAYRTPDGVDADGGGFFTLMLQPPARVDDADLRPRELVFVLDCSGSMEGFPIEKAKEVMVRAITSMRAGDRFNVVTFNNESNVLWEAPRENTEVNRRAALAYVESRQGGGGTEMRKAVVAALRQAPEGDRPVRSVDLADLPADGRRVEIAAAMTDVLSTDGEHGSTHEIRVDGTLSIALKLNAELPTVLRAEGVRLRLAGAWVTRNGRRLFVVDRVEPIFDDGAGRVRYVLFLTDGEVGNDDAVVGDVRDTLGAARLFSIGIGSSPNRSLLDAMAKAGRGASDFVSLEGDSAAAVERFVRRIERPVLTGIEITMGDGLAVHDAIPPLDAVPDLFDETPLIVHGRYTRAGAGTLTITGETGRGRYERTVNIELPEEAPDHDVIATLWARAQVDELAKDDARAQIVALGEAFQIMTKYTSFVAVEKSRLTIEGRPMLVTIPIEMPEGQSWPGTFGGIRAEELARLDVGRNTSRREAFGREQVETLTRMLAETRRETAGEIARSIEDEGGTSRIYNLVYTDPRQVADRLKGLLDQRDAARGGRRGGAGAGADQVLQSIERIEAYPDTSQLLVSGTTMDSLTFVDQVIADLDEPTTVGLPTITLKHGNANELADELNALLAETGAGATIDRSGEGLRGGGAEAGADGAGTGAPGSIDFAWQRGGHQSPESSLGGRVRVVPVGDGSVAVLAPAAQREGISRLIRSLDRADASGDPAAGRAAFGTLDRLEAAPRFANAPALDLDSALSESRSRGFEDARTEMLWSKTQFYANTATPSAPPPPGAVASTAGSLAEDARGKFGWRAGEATDMYFIDGGDSQAGYNMVGPGVHAAVVQFGEGIDPDQLEEWLELHAESVVRVTDKTRENAVRPEVLPDPAGPSARRARDISDGPGRQLTDEESSVGRYDQHPEDAEGLRALSAVIAEGRERAEGETIVPGLADRSKDLSADETTVDESGRNPILGDIPLVGEMFKTANKRPVPAADTASGPAGPAPRLTAEQVVLIIAALHESGAAEDAQFVAEALARGRPDFDLGVAIRDVLADASIDGIERGRRVDAIAGKARLRLAAVVAELRRVARLRRVLDERLWAVDEPALVTVLTTDVEEPTLEALRAAGLAIEDHSTSITLVVGTAAPEALVRLATLECVRRVEPVAGTLCVP